VLGNPFVANVPKQLSPDELVQAIRVDLAGELEAIIGYEAHAMATNDERSKRYFITSRTRNVSMSASCSSFCTCFALRKPSIRRKESRRF
jgi:hypothetical protein